MIINRESLQAVGTSFNTMFNAAFEGAESQYQLVAMEAPSGGRSVNYKWLGDMPAMKEWVGDRVVKDISEHHYEIVNKSWESTIGVDRDDIQDDEIGTYAPMIQELGREAKQHPDELVWALLQNGFTTPCYDGQYFFDDDHPIGEDFSYSNTGGGSGAPWFLLDLSRFLKPVILQWRKRPEFVGMDNPSDQEVFMRKKFLYGIDDRKNVGFGLWQIAYGSKDTLDATNYEAARAALMGVHKETGVEYKLGVKPTHLVVGSSNESAARTILVKEKLAGGEDNIWQGTAQLVVVSWLP